MAKQAPVRLVTPRGAATIALFPMAGLRKTLKKALREESDRSVAIEWRYRDVKRGTTVAVRVKGGRSGEMAYFNLDQPEVEVKGSDRFVGSFYAEASRRLLEELRKEVQAGCRDDGSRVLR